MSNLDWLLALTSLNTPRSNPAHPGGTLRPSLNSLPRFATDPNAMWLPPSDGDELGLDAVDHKGRPLDLSRSAVEMIAFQPNEELAPTAYPTSGEIPATISSGQAVGDYPDLPNIASRVDAQTHQAIDRLRARYGEDIRFNSPLTGSPDHFLVATGIKRAYDAGRLNGVFSPRALQDVARSFSAWADDYAARTDRLIGAPKNANPELPSVRRNLDDFYRGLY